MKNFSFLLLFITSICFTACGDDECNSVTLAEEISVAATAYGEATIAYTQDDSEENCLALKASINAYLDANTNLTNCDGLLSVGALGEAQVEQIESERDNLPCN